MSKKEHPSISIFFPFLNDWGTVGSLVSLAIATASKLTNDWEVILVNDGSDTKDRMALGYIVDLLNTKFQIPNSKFKGNIRIIDHEKNRGYGGALISGFQSAKKDLIFYTDCDAQYDPRELETLYKSLSHGVGMVNGYKIKRHDPIHRIIAGRMYHYLVKYIFQLPIRDTDCDFRLVRRDIFKKVKLYETTGTICTELVKKVDYFGFKIAEVPVHHYWRTSGKSQFFNFSRLQKTAVNLGKLWWKLMVKKDFLN